MIVVDVDDPADPRLDDVRDLSSKTHRPDLLPPAGRGLVIAEGVYVVGRMLTSRLRPRCIVGTRVRLDRLYTDARAEGWDPDEVAPELPFYRVTRDTLGAVIGYRSQRDVVGAADRPDELEPADVVDGARTLLVCEGLSDAENLGAIFRGAAGFGADGVLLGAGTQDPWYRRVVRVSMGHVMHVPHARLGGSPTTWHRALADLRERGFGVVALTPGGAETLAESVVRLGERTDRIAFVLGAEGPGLTERAMAECDARAAIPMAPGTDSLNVATAATLALYERSR